MAGNKFETWLGSIIHPEEMFYLVADDEKMLPDLIRRTASIGYEKFIKLAFLIDGGDESTPALDVELFRANPDRYTILDIRNSSEVKSKKIFKHSINIPLPELRERLGEIPSDKPIVVHCAGGY